MFSDGWVEAVVLPEVGARLHRLRVDDHDFLRTPDDPAVHRDDPFFWGAYVMAPWCNRIDTRPVVVGSRQVRPRANFPDGTAIHGHVYRRPWERRSDGTFRVHGGDTADWPWSYEVSLAVEVVAATLQLQLVLLNTAPDPMPGGLGLHPWFRRPVTLAIRGDEVYPSNTGEPTRPKPVTGSFDLRAGWEPPVGLDATWTRLADPPVELRWAMAGLKATLRAAVDTTSTAAVPRLHVVAATPAHLDAIAVEPQTHAPHGLRRLLDGESGGLVLLEPGASLGLAVELAFERLTPEGA